MTITKNAQGFNFFTSLDDNHVCKMNYIGYSLSESKRRFKKLVREQKDILKGRSK
jgi:hypothetical protein